VNGQAFTGDASALLEAGKRQFAITQDTTMAGLGHPQDLRAGGAYFARYLEIFENPTAAPITVDARSPQASRRHHHRLLDRRHRLTPWTTGSCSTTRQRRTRAGGRAAAATAHVFGTAGAAKAIDEVAFDLRRRRQGHDGAALERYLRCRRAARSR
jgi:hypothetical protein